jgi:hypothetical protein
MNNGRTTSTNSDNLAMDFQRRIANSAVIGSLGLTATLLILSLAGVSDPRPVGELLWADDLVSSNGWTIQSTSGQIDVPFINRELSVPPNTLVFIKSSHKLYTPGSLILSCQQLSGAPDAGYGLWIAANDNNSLVIGINTDTYLGIFEPLPSTADPVRPWRVFPHVKKFGEPNKFQLDFNEGNLTIWLNDERVTQIDYSSVSLEFGLYAETFDEKAVFKFEHLEGWQK